MRAFKTLERIRAVESSKSDTPAFFQHLWQMWKLLGIVIEVDGQYNAIFTFYSAFIHMTVTLFFPIHLCMMLFQYDNMSDNVKNLAISVTCTACSVKFLVNTTKTNLIHRFESLLHRLDSRITEGPELDFFRQLKRLLRNITVVFLVLYSLIGITAALSFVFSHDRRLLYPAWFPFNWRDNTLYFYLANLYQISGVSVLLIENYVNDLFPAMSLCVLSGHIKILAIRVANIGYNNKSKEENEKEMVNCVKDQKMLYELYSTIEGIISFPMLIQFAVTAINICVGLVALLFYVTDPLDIPYYFTYFLAMPLEIFPACYYGSDIQYRLGHLHRSVFQSNWVDQSPKFKRDMIIFTERSLKESVAMAGGMVRIHLNTFFSTCKGAYSLFAVIMRMK